MKLIAIILSGAVTSQKEKLIERWGFGSGENGVREPCGSRRSCLLAVPAIGESASDSIGNNLHMGDVPADSQPSLIFLCVFVPPW
jgi:hypothetical protein